MNLSNEDILYTPSGALCFCAKDIDVLKERAERSVRHRARVCAHQDAEAMVHEMLIVLTKEAYLQPHKHLVKAESFHVSQGLANVVVFDDQGNMMEVIQLGGIETGLNFYYKLSEARYHSVFVKTDFFVFQETCQGPFRREETVYAPWAPEEGSVQEAVYKEEMEEKIKDWICGRGRSKIL